MAISDPLVQLELGLITADTRSMLDSFSAQTSCDPMESLIKLGRAADAGFPITVGTYLYENGMNSVRFSLMMGYYTIEGLKEGDTTWPKEEKLRIYVDESATATATPFAAHANAAAYGRYSQIRCELQVNGFEGRVFRVVPRDQARTACFFMVGGRPQRKDERTGHRINQLLRLMEAVLLAHSIKRGRPFSARPWAVGFDGNRQPIWQPSGVGHGGKMALVKIEEEPMEPLLPPTFPRSSCLDRDFMLRALVEGTERETFVFLLNSVSELGFKLASLMLIQGGRVAWLLQELGFDADEALKALKADSLCTSFEVWLRASWTPEHGYRLVATPISNPATAVNVFDVRGSSRIQTVGKLLSTILKLARAVQEGRPQLLPEGGIRALATPVDAFGPALTEKELDTRSLRPAPPISFRPTGHSQRDAEMFKLLEGTSTYIQAWRHTFKLLGVPFSCTTYRHLCDRLGYDCIRSLAEAGSSEALRVRFDFNKCDFALGRVQSGGKVLWANLYIDPATHSAAVIRLCLGLMTAVEGVDEPVLFPGKALHVAALGVTPAVDQTN